MARESTAILFRMNLGYHGQISRREFTTEPSLLKRDKLPADYGVAVKYDGDNIVPLEAADEASKIAGFFVRPFPTTSYKDMSYIVAEEMNFTGDILKRGYMTIHVADASAIKKGNAVYVRNANATADSPIGSVVVAATDAVELKNAYFTGAGDEKGNVEIAYNL